MLSLPVLWGLSGCASMPRLALNQDTLTAAEHMNLGDAYQQKKEEKLAIRQYEDALRQDPRHLPALIALGNIAFTHKEWKKARSYFGKVLKLEPASAAAMNNLAMVDVAEGKHLDRAVRLAEDALLTDSGQKLKPYLMDTLAQIALLEGRYADAERFLDLASADAPKDNPEFNQHLQESRQSLAAAIKSYPSHAIP